MFTLYYLFTVHWYALCIHASGGVTFLDILLKSLKTSPPGEIMHKTVQVQAGGSGERGQVSGPLVRFGAWCSASGAQQTLCEYQGGQRVDEHPRKSDQGLCPNARVLILFIPFSFQAPC